MKKEDIIEECAKICERPWERLSPNMNTLIMEHIPVDKKSTQKEIFSFINYLMGLRAKDIRDVV